MKTKLTVVTVLTLALGATTSASASPYNRAPTIRLGGWVRTDPMLPSVHTGTRVPMVNDHIAKPVSKSRQELLIMITPYVTAPPK
jgi:hypothetical protein